MRRSEEAMRDLAALLQRAVDGPPGERYACGHLYAEVTLIGGALPAVAVYGHTLTSGQPPRVLDFHSANLFEYLLTERYDLGQTHIEEHPGTLADWRVVREDRGRGDEEAADE